VTLGARETPVPADVSSRQTDRRRAGDAALAAQKTRKQAALANGMLAQSATNWYASRFSKTRAGTRAKNMAPLHDATQRVADNHQTTRTRIRRHGIANTKTW